MSSRRRGRPGPSQSAAPDEGALFIVDNAPGGRSGLAYLREWCELATSFDIATGWFDIGALLALDGQWQSLERIRLLIGGEVGGRTRRALLDAVRSRARARLDEGMEIAKLEDPFLTGADGVVAALAEGRIECRVYDRDKFHAKAYITHGRFDVLGSQALVGSSNFTLPGLTQNVELNLKIESGPEVAQLQRWYEHHWDDAVDVSADVLRTVERHAEERSPFEVYAKALGALVAHHGADDLGWERTASRLFATLDRYQQEGYRTLMDIARNNGGAFLCDGVGLGKTFVGLMLIERLVMHEGKRVLLLAPKAVRDAVWAKELRARLPHIGGVGGGGDFSNLTVLSHTDLSRGGEFPDRLARIAELADAVVIDEAHHFRNRGPRPDDDAPPTTWSRYHRLSRLINGGGRAKQVYLLTATPINNSLNDFRHLVELFTDGDDAHFTATLGVPSVAARINALTRQARQRLERPDAPAEAVDAVLEGLDADELFGGLVVQRSRAYARASQVLEKGAATAFPEREPPRVVGYSLASGQGTLLALIDDSFQRARPLFTLAIYYPLAYYKGPNEDIDPIEENRQRQVVGLIRTNFLKRFESSLHAFERSCIRLLLRLLAFLERNATTPGVKGRYERWLNQHEGLVARVRVDLGQETDEESEDLVPSELLDAFDELPRDEYDVDEICEECLLDLDQIARLLDAAAEVAPDDDDKVRSLVALVREERDAGRKVLVFTEFADTARHLHAALADAQLGRIEQLDGSRNVDRADVIERFAPYYNGTDSRALATEGRSEIDVLVTTDVLAEGLNLQDATRLVNYDIHWNPVRLMQRIGRVDRRLNPDVERRLTDDHPSRAADRGHVAIFNFLPPAELDLLLRLYEKVSFKTLLISKTLGIEGRQFLTPDDDFDALRDFNATYEGSASTSERLHLEYQALLSEHPGLDERLAGLPGAVFSGRGGGEGGVFLCFELPALDVEQGAFTLEAGTVRWYLRTTGGAILEDVAAIADAVRSDPGTPRQTRAPRSDLLAARDAVVDHIRQSYLRALNAPLDAPRPRLVAWMEIVPA